MSSKVQTGYSITINGNTYDGIMAEILVSGLSKVKEYIISAYRDIVSAKNPEFSKKFLTDYFGLCKFVKSNMYGEDTKVFDILIESLKSSNPIDFLSNQGDENLKILARQIKGKQDVDDILDLLIGG